MRNIAKSVIVSLLVLFSALAFTVHLRLWQAFDWESLIALQSALPRSFDMPFSLLTLIGSAEITGLIFLVLVICAPSAQRLPLVLTLGIATLLELVGKIFIDQPAPPHDLFRYIPLLPLILSAQVNTRFSFPSGHALRSIFICITLAKLISASRWNRTSKRVLYLALALFEIIMLISRVYLAEHWTTDVVGGTMLGVAFALTALQWKISLPKFLQRKPF